MNTEHYMRNMEVREVCPMHEGALEICDCDCTCGGPARPPAPRLECGDNPQCRFPRLQPRGYIRSKP